jgi:hypothetical protein
LEKRGLSQESLKLIACITMFIDHVGAILVLQLLRQMALQHAYYDQLTKLYFALRIIGRIAFPIYCFLLAEGAYYTRSRKEYASRLAVGLILSEIPYDMLFYGGITFAHQSVMVTLLLGFLYAVAMNYMPSQGYRILLLLPFAMAAELLHTDYGGWGVAMIGLFVITREFEKKYRVQALGLLALAFMIGGRNIQLGFAEVPVQVFSVAALIPIALYDGSKRTNNIWVRRGFYLFCPVHLTLLYFIKLL